LRGTGEEELPLFPGRAEKKKPPITPSGWEGGRRYLSCPHLAGGKRRKKTSVHYPVSQWGGRDQKDYGAFQRTDLQKGENKRGGGPGRGMDEKHSQEREKREEEITFWVRNMGNHRREKKK